MAASGSSVRIWSRIAQPTILRVARSRTAARYSRAIRKLLSDSRTYIVEDTSVVDLFGVDAFIAIDDRKRHDRLCNICFDAVRAQPLDALRSRIDSIVGQLLAPMLDRLRRGEPVDATAEPRVRRGPAQSPRLGAGQDRGSGRGRSLAARSGVHALDDGIDDMVTLQENMCRFERRRLRRRCRTGATSKLAKKESGMSRWLNRPTGSNWGQFGDDDQVGRMNLITRGIRQRALSEAREGECFLLGLALDQPKEQIFPGRNPPRLEAIEAGDGRPMYDWPVRSNIDVINDDRVILDLQYSSQWDGLSHYGICFDADGDGAAEHVFYNGYRSDRDFIQPRAGVAPRAKALGIENLARTCVQGRGVLVDVRTAGVGEQALVGYETLMRAIDEQGADVATGDFLCLYTGYGDILLQDGAMLDRPALSACPGLDGSDRSLLDWIDRSGLVAICADNPMVEKIAGVTRCESDALLPLHEHCLVKLGIHLGEFWWFGGIAPWLAAHHRAHFLLTAPPLNLPGAVGSPATPVGTV